MNKIDNNQFEKLAEFVKVNFPEKSSELADALDLVNMVFDDIYDSVISKINEQLMERNVKNTQEIFPFCDMIIETKNIINDYSSLFVNEEMLESELSIENTDDILERKPLPDYAVYSVDTSTPHSLYEDFTHTKACGFEFMGKRYEVKNMKDVLVTLCEILAKEDRNKILSFINDPTMQGRKAPYFSDKLIIDGDVNKNEKIGDLDIYVWVNLSCNQLRNVIKRVLKKFNFKFESFKIYLRADYTELHTKKDNNIEENTNVDNIDSEEKIGKYVSSCFKKLENYPFSYNELCAMQSSEWTLNTFGFSIPLIKKCDMSKTFTEQIKINGYNRYWKNPYKLCGENYFIANQWYEHQREKFKNWFNSLGCI